MENQKGKNSNFEEYKTEALRLLIEECHGRTEEYAQAILSANNSYLAELLSKGLTPQDAAARILILEIEKAYKRVK